MPDSETHKEHTALASAYTTAKVYTAPELSSLSFTATWPWAFKDRLSLHHKRQPAAEERGLDRSCHTTEGSSDRLQCSALAKESSMEERATDVNTSSVISLWHLAHSVAQAVIA